MKKVKFKASIGKLDGAMWASWVELSLGGIASVRVPRDVAKHAEGKGGVFEGWLDRVCEDGQVSVILQNPDSGEGKGKTVLVPKECLV